MRRPRPLILGEGWFPDSPSGLNRFVRELMLALAERGIESRGVVLGPASDPPPGVVAAAKTSDPLPHRLHRFGRAAERATASTDVVDAHFALYAFRPVVMGALRGRPLVVHFHGPWADEALAAERRSRAGRVARRGIEKALYRRASRIVVLSNAFRRLLVERYGVSPWEIEVIPPGVDLRRFTPGDRMETRRALGLPTDAWIALSVRRLVPRMGLDVLLKAWAELPRDQSAPLLVLAGEGAGRTYLERTAEQLGLHSLVRFPGEVDEEQLPLWYRAADVAVVPSVALEGFGLVALEALACGTPVIVTRTGGLPAAVQALDPTLVVPPRDARSLSRRLATLRSGEAPSLERCRMHAEQFPWAEAAARTEQVYTRALRPSVARPPRVVFLDHCAQLSGAELGLLRLLPALPVQAHVVLGEDGPLVERLLAAGVSVEVLPLARIAHALPRARVRPGMAPLLSGAAVTAYAARLARRLRRMRPDLVHTYSLKADVYGTLAASPAFQLCGTCTTASLTTISRAQLSA